MKKFLSLILLTILSFNVKAQTTLTEAVDFTGTDCYGEEVINLFEILDRGQHVLIDFYFYSCPPCQTAVTRAVEAYEAFGCNKHDVFFMEVTHVDSDEICQWWAEKYGVKYPTIGRDGGGTEIQQAYGTKAYPTFVLIAPDRKILLQDMEYDSIKLVGTQYIIEQLEQFGIKQRSCDEEPAVAPEAPVVEAEATSDSTIVLTWTNVENATSYNVYADTVLVSNVTDTTYTVGGLEAKTEYSFTVTALNGALESVVSNIATATTLAGEGLAENEFSFEIHPNPVNDKLFIETKAEVKEVIVYDVYGRQQDNKTTRQQGSVIVDVANLNNGIYFVKLVTNEGEVVKRFVKK